MGSGCRHRNENKRTTQFAEIRPGGTWYKSLLRRHPGIVVRIPEVVTGMRAAITEDSIRKWFSNTKEYERCAFDKIMGDQRQVLMKHFDE